MASLTEEFDYCWTIFYPHFPYLQKPYLHLLLLEPHKQLKDNIFEVQKLQKLSYLLILYQYFPFQ